MDRFEHIYRLHRVLRDHPPVSQRRGLHTLLTAQPLLTGASPTCSTTNLRRRIKAILQSKPLGSGYPTKLFTAVYGLNPTR